MVKSRDPGLVPRTHKVAQYQKTGCPLLASFLRPLWTRHKNVTCIHKGGREVAQGCTALTENRSHARWMTTHLNLVPLQTPALMFTYSNSGMQLETVTKKKVLISGLHRTQDKNPTGHWPPSSSPLRSTNRKLRGLSSEAPGPLSSLAPPCVQASSLH